MEYHARIHPTRRCFGNYKEWTDRDLIGKLQPMLDNGQLRLLDNGMIGRAMAPNVIQHNTPWLHAKHLPCMECYRDHHIKFNFFGYIPPRCLECWKVVAMPRTVKELFKLRKLQCDLGKASKCGIEMRHYTQRLYGGYFYTRSLDEGQARYKEVREAINDSISPDVKVILKRGCTEFEMTHGPSDTWAIADNFLDLDYYIDNHCDFQSKTIQTAQGSLCENRIHQLWVDWAYAHGDETYSEFTGGQPLYPSPVTYHDVDSGAAKVQLSANRVMRLHGTSPQKVGEALKKMGEIQEELGIGRNELGRIMGFHNISPFNIQGHMEL